MNISDVFEIAESNSFDNPMTMHELGEVIHTIQLDAWEKHGECIHWSKHHMFTNGREYDLVSIAVNGEYMKAIDGMVLLVTDNC